MEFKLSGQAGLHVSELCLDIMTFGEGLGPLKEPAKLPEPCLDERENFIGTANDYTNGSREHIPEELPEGIRIRFSDSLSK